MSELVFLKLGGSLITDKRRVEEPRLDVIEGAAGAVAKALEDKPGLKIVVAHGSGSFGHVAASRYGTRGGAMTPSEWAGYARVSDSAARLNAIVRAALLRAGLPAVTLQPSASAVCRDGEILSLATDNVSRALEAGIIPLLYGDVAFDVRRGGTIISTEEIFGFLAEKLRPTRLLMAAEVAGVMSESGDLVTQITARSFPSLSDALGGADGTDVTGGMISKVRHLLDMVASDPQRSAIIFSGLVYDNIYKALIGRDSIVGTFVFGNGGPSGSPD